RRLDDRAHGASSSNMLRRQTLKCSKSGVAGIMGIRDLPGLQGPFAVRPETTLMRLFAVLLAALVLATGGVEADDRAKEKTARPLVVLVACSKGQLSRYEKWLQENYHIKCLWAGDGFEKRKKGEKPSKERDIVGMEQAEKCDVMLLNLYRVTPNEKQLALVK